MALSGFKAQNHPQQTRKRGANPEVDDRATPPELFDPLNERFRFTIDVAASSANTKLPRFYSTEDDGLARSWANERVWCNPPYSDIRPWVEKAWLEWRRIEVDDIDALGAAYLVPSSPELIVMLLPSNRTEQGWWQELVEPHRDQGGDLSVEFLPGRPRFICVGETAVLPNQRPPFGCCLLIWDAGGR